MIICSSAPEWGEEYANKTCSITRLPTWVCVIRHDASPQAGYVQGELAARARDRLGQASHKLGRARCAAGDVAIGTIGRVKSYPSDLCMHTNASLILWKRACWPIIKQRFRRRDQRS